MKTMAILAALALAVCGLLIFACDLDAGGGTYDCSKIQASVDQCVAGQGTVIESQCNSYTQYAYSDTGTKCSDTEKAYDCYKKAGDKCAKLTDETAKAEELAACAALMP